MAISHGELLNNQRVNDSRCSVNVDFAHVENLIINNPQVIKIR